MWWLRIVLILIGYVFGLFQTGYFYGKLVGVDLKKVGSGNTGATNALRVMGLKGGLIVFFFDALKAFIPCFVVMLIFKEDPMRFVWLGYTALGVILGNNYPFYLKFNGGKGVAATAGYGFAWSWPITLIGLGLFFTLAFTTGYVSLSSIIVSLFVIGACAVFGFIQFGPTCFQTPEFLEFFILIVVLSFILIWRHRSNIKRLLSGTENRFGKKRQKKSDETKAADAEAIKEVVEAAVEDDAAPEN